MKEFARRMLSLFLAVIMVAGMVPMGAFAEETSAETVSLTEETVTTEAASETTQPPEPAPAPTETSQAATEAEETTQAPTETTTEETTQATEETVPETTTGGKAPMAVGLYSTEEDEGENKDYLQADWLIWNDEGQLTYDEIAGENRSLIIGAATDVHFYIFFKYTYNEETGTYDKTPVVPTPGDNLVIEECAGQDEIAAGEEYSAYFVRLYTTGTIDDGYSSVTVDDLSMEVQISKLLSGFFSTTEASAETYISEFQMNTENDPGNEFYWIYRGEGTVTKTEVKEGSFSSTIGICGNKEQMSASVEMEKMADADNVYKVTIGDIYARYAKYDSHLEWCTCVNAEASCADEEGETYTEKLDSEVRIYAGEDVLKCANIRINEKDYHFYEDGAIFCTHETDETITDDDGETWHIWLTDPVYVEGYVNAKNDEEIGLPTGVSYDYKTNTLTLDGATLDNLYLTHYYDWDGTRTYDLPEPDVTLELKNTSTINESFNVWDHAEVTLSGDGSLILKGEVNIYDGTLDMTKNHILLDTGSVVNVSEDSVTGGFWYVEGYTDLQLKWLWNDGSGYDLYAGEPCSTANCWPVAQFDYQVVFYEYKWEKQGENSYGWTITPVVPTSDDWEITKIDVSEIKTGAEDGNCYVNIRYTKGITNAKTTLTANGTDFSMWTSALNFGFYTAAEANVDNLLESQTQYTLSNEEDNVVYLVVNDPYDDFTSYSIDWYLGNLNLKLDDYVTITEQEGGVYKLEFKEACLNYNDILALNGKVTLTFSGQEETSEDYVYLQLINPNQKPLAARFYVDPSEGIHYRYDYYTDNTSRVFIQNAEAWNVTDNHVATGFSYDLDTNILTLNNANIHWLTLVGSNLPERKLTISLTGTNVVDYMDISGGADVTIQGSGNMKLRGGLYLNGASALTLNSATKLYMYRPEEMAFHMSEDSTFTGTFSYETTEFIAVRALDISDAGATLSDESYTPIEESGIMGMQERVLVFYKTKYDGKEWTYTPVKPTVYSDTANRIAVTAYTGNVVDEALTEEEIAAAVYMKSNDLGGYNGDQPGVELTIDGKQYDWRLYDLHLAYYSSTTPSPETYLGNGDNRDQHYFDTEVGGDNTFYLIIREKDTGITVTSDVDWIIDTWGQNYKELMGLDEDEELVKVTDVSTPGSGNLVYQITVSDKYVNYVNYGWNWKNFSIAPIVTWQYSDGNQSTSDYWCIYINPPQETMQPILRREGEDVENNFNLYADGKVYGNDGKETTLPENVIYDADTMTLTLNNVELSAAIELYGDSNLNLIVKGQNTLNALILHDSATITVTGENGSVMTADASEDQGGTLTIVGELCVDGGATLTIAENTSLVLDESCVKKVSGAVNGDLTYAEGYSEIEIWTLWGDEALHGPYNLSDGILMGMSDCSALFLRKTWMDNSWDCVVVKPKENDVLIVNPCDCDPNGYADTEGEEYKDEDVPAYLLAITKDDLVNLYANTFASNKDGAPSFDLTLTAEGYEEIFDWYVAPTIWGYFSKPEADLDNWLYGDAQHFFSLDPNGDNTFYFITMADNCGYTLDSVKWDVDTYGKDYSCFGDLMKVEEVDKDGQGNRVWKITVGEGYVNLCKYFGAVWNNFKFYMEVKRTYPGGDTYTENWDMYVNPGIAPEDTIYPEANFTINGYTYYYYKNVSKILKSGWDADGNPDVSWIKSGDLSKHLPKGVSFDKKNNKMTLNNATLESLSFRGYALWIDDETEDQEEIWVWTQIMPKDMVTLELKGTNTIQSYCCEALNLRWGADMTIAGSGTLNILTTNDGGVDEEGNEWFSSSPAVRLSDSSDLVIAGKAKVKVVNSCADGNIPQQWLFGIEADGGNASLTIKDNATLEVRLPEGVEYLHQGDEDVCGYALIHTSIPWTNEDGEPGDSGVKTINIQDNAKLLTDAVDFNGATLNMTGGTWEMDSSLSQWNDGADNYTALYAEESTLNISGGKLNITQGAPDEEHQDTRFFGIQLTCNSVLNVTGGEINIDNKANGGFGIIAYGDEENSGTLNVSGGTINVKTKDVTADDEAWFVALNTDVGSTFTMTGGTINGQGEMAPLFMTMEGGTINQTSTRGDGFFVINGTMEGGKIDLTNAGFQVDPGGSFHIDGGEITITSDYVGLVNKGYLSMTDGNLIIDVAGTIGIENWGTFHQMGGEVNVEASGNYPAVVSHGSFLLNSGSMDLTGPIGIVQADEWKNEYWDYDEDKGGDPMLQTGGGVGDHKLTIHATNVGILANGIVHLTGGSTVNIDVRNTDGPAYGIRAERHGADSVEEWDVNSVNLTNVIIDGAAKVTVTAKSDSGTSIALDAWQAPVTIQTTTLDENGTLLTPTIHLKAGTYAILDERADQYTSNFDIDEELALYSGGGRLLLGWMEADNGQENWYAQRDENGSNAKEVRISAPTDVKATYARFDSINGDAYRIHEDDGKQIVERWDLEEVKWVETTLPKGVTYNLSTNTLTLAKNTTLSELVLNYEEVYFDKSAYNLPSQNFTLKLNTKATIGRLDLGGNVNAKLTGGTLYLTNGSDATSALTATLTVAKGAGLTINAKASLLVYSMNEYYIDETFEDPQDEHVPTEGNLIVEKGATLTNNGSLYMNHLAGGGKINVLGTYKHGGSAYTIVWHEYLENITGNLLKKYQTVVANVKGEYDLNELNLTSLAASYKEVWVDADDVTLTTIYSQNFVIPAKVILNPNWIGEEGSANALTISEGVTLTIKGTLSYGYSSDLENVSKIINNGTIKLEKGGVLDVNGNFVGNAPVNNGGKIYPQASKVTVTANKTAIDLYELEKWESKPAEESLDADEEIQADKPEIVLTVNVATKASEKPLHRVTWTSSNKSVIDPADIEDNQDGTYTITAYKGTGKVTLTATTIDGAKKTAKITLNVTYAGSAKLTAELEGSYSTSFLQVGELAQMWVTTTMGEDRDVYLTMEESDYAPNVVAFYMGDAAYTGNYVITFKSSNPKVATVDGWGNIEGIKAGTAKITATMNIKGDKRSVTITVKVVNPQILRVNLYEDYTLNEEGEGRTLTGIYNANREMDLADLNADATLRTLHLYAGQLTWNADWTVDTAWENEADQYIAASKLKWACSDTGIATVKTHKDGYAIVTIKKGAHGVFTITATATDTNKAVGSATFVIKDYTPRLANPSITLNPKLDSGVKLQLIESYENSISSVTFVPDSTKNAEKLEVVYEEGVGYSIQAILDDSGKLANQTIKGKLYIKTGRNDPEDKEDVYKLSITVAVKNSEPKITVTQDTSYGKLDLSYRYQYFCPVEFTSSIGEVWKVELAKDSTPHILLDTRYYYYDDLEEWYYYDTEYDHEKDYEWTDYDLRMAENCPSKINTKVKFNVYVTGYQAPIVVSFTPKTTTSKITVTTDPTKTVLNGNAANYDVSFALKVNGSYLDLWTTDDIDGEEYNEYYDDYYRGEVVSVTYNKQPLGYTVDEDGQINLSISKEDYPKGFNGNVSVEVKHPQWSQHKTVTHNISTTTKAPSVTVGTPTMTLYTKFPKNYATTTVSLNQSNLELTGITGSCSNAEGKKLAVTPDKNGISVGFATGDGETYTIPKTGTYTFNAVASYTDPATEATKEIKFTFKVKVVSSEPSIKLSSNTIKLNTALAGQEEGFVAAKFNWSDLELSGNGDLWIAGYEINGTEVLFPQDKWVVDEDGNEYWEEGTPTYYRDNDRGIQLTALQYYEGAQSYANFAIVASLTKADAKKTTYTIRPIVHDYTFEKQYTLSTKLSLTVQPHSSKISVTTKASGKLEILNPDSQVVYAITKVSNVIWGDINNVELLKQDGKNWVPYEKNSDENGWWYTEEPMFYTDLTHTLQSGKYYQAVMLWVNTNYEYTAGKTYQFKLRYYFGEGDDAYYVDSAVLKLKMNSSTAKVSASTLNFYHAEVKSDSNVQKTITLNMTSPTGARFDSVKLNKSKTSKELIAALTPPDAEEEVIDGCFVDEDVTFMPNGTTANLDVQFYNSTALTAGKSYYLYLDVYPYTLANGKPKPVTVKVTVKVNK